MKFWIISPSYRAKDFLHFHINSVKSQVYKNFHHILILDDANSDEIDIADSYRNLSSFSYIKTNKSGGALVSHLLGIEKAVELGMQPEDVIVHLDGDDWFFHPYVLQLLENVYTAQDCWATYGNYISTDGSPSICRPVNEKISRLNLTHWYFSHLRTFKYFLFQQIKPEDFKDDDDQYFRFGGDVALIVPIIELCPLNKTYFINFPNVVYNRFSPINDDKVNILLQRRTGIILSKRNSYKEISE